MKTADAEFLERFRKRPPLSVSLFKLHHLGANQEEARFGFEFTSAHCAPSGFVQGGMITAVLDDVASQSALRTIGADWLVPTLDFHITFYSGIRPGAYRATGRVTRKKKIGFLASHLIDAQGEVLAQLSGTCLIKPIGGAK